MNNITPNGFIVVDINDDMRSAAQSKATEMGVLRNSIRNGEGNLCGFLGEEVVLKALEGAVSANTFQHDIVYDNLTFEVKTKDRTVSPRINFEASVANYNSTQQADYYIFVSLLRDGDEYVKGYVCGLIPKEMYKKEAVYLKVGDRDPSNGWVVKAACYNLPYEKLSRFGPVEED